MAAHNNQGERGSALVMVLIFCAALLILGGALSTLTLNDNFIAANQVEDSRLYYITEAGIEAGVAAVSRYFNYSDEIEGQIDGGGYETEVIWGPTLSVGHRYYEILKDVQINPMDERLIISTGRLGDREMAMAVIVKLHPLARKALMVSNKLTIEDSTIYGNIHVNDQFHIKGINHVLDGELTYTLLDRVQWEIQKVSTITVITGAGEATYSKDNNFTTDMRAPRIKIPPLYLDRFLREANHTYIYDQTWNKTGDCDDNFEVILVKRDLTICPGDNQTIELTDKVIIVEGNLNITVKNKAAANFIDCVFVTNGKVSIKGSINKGVTDPDSNMVLFVAGADIAIDDVEDSGEDSMFFGGRMLLFSQQNVSIKSKYKFDMYGTIIAEQVSLFNCGLHYVPDIFDEYGAMLGLGVVMQEWIKPWRPL
jgi:hypothetical protein